MADASQLAGWIVLFIGIYSIAAALGELLRPGGWLKMLDEIERSPAIRFLAGIVILGLGALIYLASPWQPGDWLSIVVTVIGGGMVLEGVLFLAFGEQFTAVSRALIGSAGRAWAMLALLIGVLFVILGIVRV